MAVVVFELFANMRRIAGTDECRVDVDDAVRSVADALASLAAARPDLAGLLDRCACVSGDTVIRRADALPVDGRIALLPPVAGG
ncbi:molybdopterin synthase sulfur carrier subunit [Luteibacter sp. Sphag1AF]|uniref:MoaD/ThiS family protein n=1 Tax=Luteibacter sp. Sphag1AF TaxID=2587031 RepID=UPI001611EDCD|nr:MoaD/ThiS family protein [Luteibacter sp. Sphag1AF]MBB3225766.1 molybdopterin synthase sulfur carrier subunit [Luteibacter sp. Sphag1AF]